MSEKTVLICDKCNKEWTHAFLEPKTTINMGEGVKHLCKECTEELKTWIWRREIYKDLYDV